MPPKKPSKWQQASAKVVKLRYELEDAINNGFSPAEKKSKKYRQMLDSIYLMFSHAFHEYIEELKKEQRLELNEKKARLKVAERWNFIWKLITIAATILGAVATEIIKALMG